MTAALVVALAVLVPVLLTRLGEEESAQDTGLAAVVSYDDLPVDHVDGDVDYEQSPPVGGPHADEWLDCGVYDAPVPEENLVHDLEHGTVVITHDPELAAEEVERLAVLLPDNGILAPHPEQGAPVVVTVWGRQLELEGADDTRLPLFLDQYGAGETAPEPFASCAGGTADPTGGASAT
ncbi:DUF3105 domain-containing protein [Nocardioides sp. SYSU D00038]|uniref:DUF3105 domain-containing protein n=1 Tax=Nocardioides sp. SYSU D00038 TaxID=2812554 RepID=UPI001968794F|nr:DUF3105 domain-containing protein [Nocardioides sp. SYSU D00038]